MTKEQEDKKPPADSTEEAFKAGVSFGEAIAMPDCDVPRVAVNEVQKPSVYFLDEAACPTAIAIPEGYILKDTREMVESFERMLPAPRRRRGHYGAADIKSLLAWMTANCTEDSPVFGVGAEHLADEWRAPKVALVGVGNYSNRTDAQWHDFGCRYSFPVTVAWKEWAAFNKVWLNQKQFSDFIHSHLYEISAPLGGETLGEAATRMIEAYGGSKQVASPTKMYEVAQGVKLTVASEVEVTLDRSTGESSLRFKEEHKGKGGRPTGIPKFFWIRLPVFFGEPSSLIGASLNYSNEGGGVSWQYELCAPELVVKEAFDRACNVVKHEGRTLFLGSPDFAYQIPLGIAIGTR
jgi:hypothetical protein